MVMLQVCILRICCFIVSLFTIDTGFAGKNNGKGYYIYEKGSKPRPDFTVLPIIEESRRLANIMPGGKVSLSKKTLAKEKSLSK